MVCRTPFQNLPPPLVPVRSRLLLALLLAFRTRCQRHQKKCWDCLLLIFVQRHYKILAVPLPHLHLLVPPPLPNQDLHLQNRRHHCYCYCRRQNYNRRQHYNQHYHIQGLEDKPERCPDQQRHLVLHCTILISQLQKD